MAYSSIYPDAHFDQLNFRTGTTTESFTVGGDLEVDGALAVTGDVTFDNIEVDDLIVNNEMITLGVATLIVSNPITDLTVTNLIVTDDVDITTSGNIVVQNVQGTSSVSHSITAKHVTMSSGFLSCTNKSSTTPQVLQEWNSGLGPDRYQVTHTQSSQLEFAHEGKPIFHLTNIPNANKIGMVMETPMAFTQRAEDSNRIGANVEWDGIEFRNQTAGRSGVVLGFPRDADVGMSISVPLTNAGNSTYYSVLDFSCGDGGSVGVHMDVNGECSFNAARVYVPALANSATGINIIADSTTSQLYFDSSTRRHKHAIRRLTIENVSEILQELQICSYKRNETNQKEIGLIAEDVGKIDPKLILLDSQGIPLAINKHNLLMYLLAEVQNLRKEIEDTGKRTTGKRTTGRVRKERL